MEDNSRSPDEQNARLDQQIAHLKEYLASHSNDSPTPPVTDGRSECCWNVFSVIAPAVGVGLGLFAAYESSKHNGDPLGLRGLVLFYLTCFGCTVFGLVAAIVAHYRRERRSGLTVVGLFLNGILTI